MINQTRSGDWVLTASGREFWPLDPHPAEIIIEDIAHALSNICRFGGHCRAFYSIAQHSVLVSRIVSPEYALWGLLHDATEAYLLNLPAPVKRFVPDYAPAEARVMHAICQRFGLAYCMPMPVKVADQMLLADEVEVLMPRSFPLPYPPSGIEIDPLPPKEAKELFLDRFHFLESLIS